jgi:hypothetical protein
MKTIIKSTLMVALFALVLTGCHKFEDGPAFSLRTVKARVTGTWTVESATDNGVDVTSLSQALIGTWTIAKDNTYKLSGLAQESGTWKLGEDKDDIFFTPSNGGTMESYRILRCKNKELWLRQVYSNGTFAEIKLKQ